MNSKTNLRVTLAEQRLSQAVELSTECFDETGKKPKDLVCARAMDLVGRLSALTLIEDGADLKTTSELNNDHCPSMNTPRCPLYQDAEVIQIDTRQAS